MLIACWSVKGGSGTTTIAAGLASMLARTHPVTVLDLGGDIPAALGMPEPDGPGLADWLSGDATGPEEGGPDAVEWLRAVAVPVHETLRVVPAGADDVGGLDLPRAAEGLAVAATELDGMVVADCGRPGPASFALASAAGLSLLVLRPCFLALRRAVRAPLRPSSVLLLVEPDRALDQRDVADVLGVPVTPIPIDPEVARAIDAGLLASRVPRRLASALRKAA